MKNLLFAYTFVLFFASCASDESPMVDVDASICLDGGLHDAGDADASAVDAGPDFTVMSYVFDLSPSVIEGTDGSSLTLQNDGSLLAATTIDARVKIPLSPLPIGCDVLSIHVEQDMNYGVFSLAYPNRANNVFPNELYDSLVIDYEFPTAYRVEVNSPSQLIVEMSCTEPPICDGTICSLRPCGSVIRPPSLTLRCPL